MKLTIALVLVSAGIAVSAPAPYPLTVNSRSPSSPAVTVGRATESAFALTLVDGASPSILSNVSVWMVWYTNDTASSISTANVSIVTATSGTCSAVFSPSSLNFPIGRYYYQVGTTSNGTPKLYGFGTFNIIGSPFATGAGAIVWTTNVNLSLLTFAGTMPLGNVAGAVGSVAINGVTNTPDGSGLIDLGTIGGSVASQTPLTNHVNASGFNITNVTAIRGSTAGLGYGWFDVDTNWLYDYSAGVRKNRADFHLCRLYSYNTDEVMMDFSKTTFTGVTFGTEALKAGSYGIGSDVFISRFSSGTIGIGSTAGTSNGILMVSNVMICATVAPNNNAMQRGGIIQGNGSGSTDSRDGARFQDWIVAPRLYSMDASQDLNVYHAGSKKLGLGGFGRLSFTHATSTNWTLDAHLMMDDSGLVASNVTTRTLIVTNPAGGGVVSLGTNSFMQGTGEKSTLEVRASSALSTSTEIFKVTKASDGQMFFGVNTQGNSYFSGGLNSGSISALGRWQIEANEGLRYSSQPAVAWSSGNTATATPDTAISRISAGIIGIGTGVGKSNATLWVSNIVCDIPATWVTNTTILWTRGNLLGTNGLYVTFPGGTNAWLLQP